MDPFLRNESPRLLAEFKDRIRSAHYDALRAVSEECNCNHWLQK